MLKKKSNHKDLTKIPFVTIDGEDSKDYDDAVWSENYKKKTKVMIAIADVSYYVKNDPLDIEAKKATPSISQIELFLCFPH